MNSYSEKTAKEIKKRMDAGESLKDICRDDHMPTKLTAEKWIKENKWKAFDDSKSGIKERTNYGRPSVYTDAIAMEIIERTINNESLRSIVKDDHMPALSTVMKWRLENYNGFSEQYDIAFAARLQLAADELLDIADDSRNDFIEKAGRNGESFISVYSENIGRSRLRVDTRKWLMSKLLPKFADKQTLDHTSSDGTMTPQKEPTSFEINFVKPDFSEFEDQE